jgi:hypothetical protein
MQLLICYLHLRFCLIYSQCKCVLLLKEQSIHSNFSLFWTKFGWNLTVYVVYKHFFLLYFNDSWKDSDLSPWLFIWVFSFSRKKTRKDSIEYDSDESLTRAGKIQWWDESAILGLECVRVFSLLTNWFAQVILLGKSLNFVILPDPNPAYNWIRIRAVWDSLWTTWDLLHSNWLNTNHLSDENVRPGAWWERRIISVDACVRRRHWIVW